MSTNSINSNFAAVAAPIFDYSGRIVAALTVLGTDKLLAGPRYKSTAGTLLEASRRLSERLGASERHRKAETIDDKPIRQGKKT